MEIKLKDNQDLYRDVFRPVYNHPEYYISTSGRVLKVKSGQSLKEAKELKTYESKKGYLAFTIAQNGSNLTKQVAREILKAFTTGWENFKVTRINKHGRKIYYRKWYAGHVNGDTLDNNLSNLAFLTGKDKIESIKNIKYNKEIYKLSSKWQQKRKD